MLSRNPCVRWICHVFKAVPHAGRSHRANSAATAAGSCGGCSSPHEGMTVVCPQRPIRITRTIKKRAFVVWYVYQTAHKLCKISPWFGTGEQQKVHCRYPFRLSSRSRGAFLYLALEFRRRTSGECPPPRKPIIPDQGGTKNLQLCIGTCLRTKGRLKKEMHMVKRGKSTWLTIRLGGINLDGYGAMHASNEQLRDYPWL